MGEDNKLMQDGDININDADFDDLFGDIGSEESEEDSGEEDSGADDFDTFDSMGIKDEDFGDFGDDEGDEEDSQEGKSSNNQGDSSGISFDFGDDELGSDEDSGEQSDINFENNKSSDLGIDSIPDSAFGFEDTEDNENSQSLEQSGDGDLDNSLNSLFPDEKLLDTASDETENNIGHKKLFELSPEEINSLSIEELERLQQEEGIMDDSTDRSGDDGFETMTVAESLDEFDKSIGADHDGAILDGDSLLIDSLDTVDKDKDFISNTGEIVVMDNNDNGDNFKFQYIDIENIAIVKRIRKNTTNVEDLVQSIKSTGLLEPLVVAPTQTEGIYVLLAGFRRIMACAKAGKRNIPCIINIKANVPEIPVLEALYNHSKQYTIKEIVDYIDYLEKQKGIMSASMIEYLLQLNSGDYTKLKDILNDNDDDIVDKLFNGIYTIEMAFKKLEQRRKKESAEEKENKKAAKVYEDEEESGASNIAGSGDEAADEGLTEDEIQGLAISAGDIDSADDEDFKELVEEGENVEGFKPHKQDYKERERLDPALRKAVLARDNNTCQICKIISGQEFTEVLDVHHIVEVYLGGDDSINNLITACTVCHKLVHLYGRGELHIRPEDELTEEEKPRFKRIIKLGTVIRKGMAAKGMKKEQIKKLDGAETIGRTKPGTGQVAG